MKSLTYSASLQTKGYPTLHQLEQFITDAQDVAISANTEVIVVVDAYDSITVTLSAQRREKIV